MTDMTPSTALRAAKAKIGRDDRSALGYPGRLHYLSPGTPQEWRLLVGLTVVEAMEICGLQLGLAWVSRCDCSS